MKDCYTTFTSESLLSLMQNDDPAAFEELYNRYWFQLFVTAHKRLPCREDAEEAVQNLYESLWKNRHKIHIRTSLENYLFSAIRYIVLRMLYKKRAASIFPGVIEENKNMLDYSTEEVLLANDLSMQIDKIVETLPEKCRRVYELSRHEMKTHKEIAALMNISEKTIENHITKALHLIKKNLHSFFFL